HAFAADSYSGAWDTQNDKGWNYAMHFSQHGNHVIGSWVAKQDGSKGKINGSVHDGELDFHWTQGEFKGEGQFFLSDDGNSFSGVYTAEDNPKLPADYASGKWTGTRSAGGGEADTGNADFSGMLAVQSDKGWFYNFTVSQDGETVTGAYAVLTPDKKPSGS